MSHPIRLVAILLLLAIPARAQLPEPPANGGGRINQLKVLSDKIDDVTTVENIVKSFVKPGMSDQERAEALWTAVVKYRHQTAPPNEYLAGDWEAHDPVKIFNVYGYCMCCCCSALVEALNREDGREARGRILNGHSVPEVRYGNGWHMFDGSLITFFPRPDDGVAASVDEIAAAIADWYAKHPGYQKNGEKILQLMTQGRLDGLESRGPRPAGALPVLPARLLPGADARLGRHHGRIRPQERGLRVRLPRRPPGPVLAAARRIVRPRGGQPRPARQHGRRPELGRPQGPAPENDLVYLKEFFPGYRGGVVANGIHRYAPDLAGGRPRSRRRGLRQPRLGRLAGPPRQDAGQARRGRDPDGLAVCLSGRPAAAQGRGPVGRRSADRLDLDQQRPDFARSIPRAGRKARRSDDRPEGQDLPPLCVLAPDRARRGGAGLDRLEIENDFQHAPRTLPWLGKGTNTITVAADRDPTIATRSIACRITPDAVFTKNETSSTMGVMFDNVDLQHDACWWKGGTGLMTVPVDVPGDLVALGFSAQVRARGEKDRVRSRCQHRQRQDLARASP